MLDKADPQSQPSELILLGTGTSVGVPVLGCQCKVCTSVDPKLHRTRASAVIATPAGRILIDAGPDLRQQFLREKFSHADAILMTHHHADHVMGLDDVRVFAHYRGDAPLPIYCDPEVESVIRRAFSYAFDPAVYLHSKTAVPIINFERIQRPSFQVLGVTITPIPLKHGPLDVLGFRVGDVAYCTDVNHIPEESFALLAGVKHLVLDALRLEPHPTHFGLMESLQAIERIQPTRAYLTHIACRLDPDEAARHLPSHVELAYDGLRILISDL
ncbi:MBL fold metallo-hydrolase [bacterium]|nr:MBL fold metallo-hydrolase [bacterium]